MKPIFYIFSFSLLLSSSCIKQGIDQEQLIDDFLIEALKLNNDIMSNDSQLILKVFNETNQNSILRNETSINHLLELYLKIDIETDYESLVTKYHLIIENAITKDHLINRLIEGTLEKEFTVFGFKGDSFRIDKCCGQKMFEFVVSTATTVAGCVGCPVTLVSCGTCGVGSVFTIGLFIDTLNCGCWS